MLRSFGAIRFGTRALRKKDDARGRNSRAGIDRQAAEEYVIALYKYVLNRDIISTDEMFYWSEEIVKGRPSGEVLRLFFESKEYKSRKSEVVKTKFPNGHFYSPVVNTVDLSESSERVFGAKSISAIDLNVETQAFEFSKIAPHFHAMPFQDQKVESLRYYFSNSSYGFGDALIYWGMIANLRPTKILEIGCGFTSALALDAIDHFRLDTLCTFVDPFPDLLQRVAAPIPPRHVIHAKKVQEIDPKVVLELKENDILFIDSSHVVKTGSDVHFEIMEMLPKVRQGVVIHFHDVFYPFEYPKPWVLEDNLSWNEVYFLQSFLMFNTAFHIMYFNDFFGKKRPELVREFLPSVVAERVMLNPGGGLWLRKLAGC